MPTTDTFAQGFTALDYGDVPDLKVMGDGLLKMAGQTVMRFSSASSRNANLTAPVAGMVAWCAAEKLLTVYDGTAWVAVASGTQSWTTPALATGYTGNGNSNGTPQYRLVNLFGDSVVMWKGGLNVTYSSGTPVNGGNFISGGTLPAAVRPTARRTVTAACSAVSSDSLSVKIDFQTDGTVGIVTQGGVTPPWVSLNNIMYSL